MAPSPWSHAQSWLSGLQRYAFPRIGKMPVSEVSSADVLEILSPIWHVKPDMAGKLRQHMRAVLEWAVAMELRIHNPCDRVGPLLGPQHKVVEHMRALPHRRRRLPGWPGCAADRVPSAELDEWHRARCSGRRGALPRGRRVTVVPVAIILAARGVAGRQLPAPFWRQITPRAEGTLTRVALVEQLADVADLTKKRAEVIVETVFGSIAEALHREEKVELRRFGSFRLRRREPRRARNPKTGDRVDVASKHVAYFTTGKELINRTRPSPSRRP